MFSNLSGAHPRIVFTTTCMGESIMWKTPVVREVAVGLEINCYACAEV